MKLKVKSEKTSAMVKSTGIDPCTHTTCLNIKNMGYSEAETKYDELYMAAYPH